MQLLSNIGVKKKTFFIVFILTSAILAFSLTALASPISFETVVTYSTGNGPYGLSVGDLDGDGTLDLVVPNALGDNISVLFGSSDGTFLPKVDYPAGSQPIRSVVTDLDRDGHPDVAVANHCVGGSCNIYVYMGSEDGALETPTIYPTEGGPYDLLAGDYNGDGSQDIVVVNGVSNSISFFAGDTSGDLQPQVSSASGGYSIGMTQGDFNEDGILDLATSNHVNETISVILGSGDGTFPSLNVISFPSGSRPSAIATADINKDDNTDLVVSSSLNDTVYTLLGSGDGTFSAPVGYPTGTYTNDVMVADMNGDTRVDIVTPNFDAGTLSLLVQNAGGTFDTAQTLTVGVNPIALEISDFNGDGLTDIAVSNFSSYKVSILLQEYPDVTPPIDPTPLSTSHTVGQWSNDTTIDISLSGATDDTGVSTFETRISTNGSNQSSSPVIYGDKIVWEDFRNGNFDIYMYDLTTLTESQITTNGSHQYYPAIYGDKIVWQDGRNGNYDVYMYDLTTLTESRITTNGSEQYSPVIYGDKIVWEDNRNGNYDVYMYDLTALTESQITTNGTNQLNASIYGNKIVWHDYRNLNWDIYMYDLTASTESQITPSNNHQLRPAIYGDNIVWEDYRNGPADIYMYNLTASTESRITTNSSDQKYPAIYSDKIVWEDNRNGDWDIYMYDLTASTESQITTHGTHQYYPAIYGDKIVWQDGRNGGWDIYMNSLGVAVDTSGVDGFSYSFTEGAASSQDVPDAIKDIEESASSVTSAALGNGTHYFHIRTVDNAGNWTSTAHGGPYLINVTAPDTKITASPAETISTRDATFTWIGSDDISGSADMTYSYMLVSSDADWSAYSSSKTKTYTGLPNGTYTFKVRAKDQAGNVDATPAQKTLTVKAPTITRYEETSGQIGYKSSCWNNYANAALSGGSARISKKIFCTATFSYTGKKVEFISAKAKQLGKTKIYVDNVLQTTLDLYSSTTMAQQVAYTKSHLTVGAHTLKIEVLGTKNTKATDSYIPIDAFLVTS